MNNYAGLGPAAQALAGLPQQGASFGTTGYMQTQQGLTDPPPVSILECQVKRLTGSVQSIDVAATRLHALADRLTGPEPAESGKTSVPVPNPTTSIGKLNDAQEWLETSYQRLAHAISRLERL